MYFLPSTQLNTHEFRHQFLSYRYLYLSVFIFKALCIAQSLSAQESLDLVLTHPVGGNNPLYFYQNLSAAFWAHKDDSGAILEQGEVSSLLLIDLDDYNVFKTETYDRAHPISEFKYRLDVGGTLHEYFANMSDGAKSYEIRSYHFGRVFVVCRSKDEFISQPISNPNQTFDGIQDLLKWLVKHVNEEQDRFQVKMSGMMFIGNTAGLTLIEENQWTFSINDKIDTVEKFFIKIMNDSPVPMRIRLLRQFTDDLGNSSPIPLYYISYLPGSTDRWAMSKETALALEAKNH